jgi:fructokinase
VVSDIAELAAAILLTTSSQRILIGGGVDRARVLLLERQAAYLPYLDAATALTMLRTPALADRAGPLGAIALAMAAVDG